MTEQKLINSILEIAPKVFDCSPNGLGAQRRAEVIAGHLMIEGVVVPTCRCWECVHARASVPNYIECPLRGGRRVRLDGYCDEAEPRRDI